MQRRGVRPPEPTGACCSAPAARVADTIGPLRGRERREARGVAPAHPARPPVGGDGNGAGQRDAVQQALVVGVVVDGTVLGRGVAHLTIFLPALAFYFIVLPRFYGFSTLGQPLQLFALASVFALATSFMGQTVGAWFNHPETPTLIFLGTSLPQLFLTGFSWPREAIPEPIQAVGYIFPSFFAIDGLVRINQLGANLWEVARDWRGLWILAIIYFTLAVMSALFLKRRQAHG